MSSLVGLIRPEALPLLGAVVLLALVAVWGEIRRRRALVAFAGAGAELASVSEARRRLKIALVLLALVSAVVGLAGPFVDVVERTVVQRGVDVVVAFDVSQSMAVRDVAPDRLRAGKDFIQRLGHELTQSRVALVLYAGEGILRYPPTADPSVLGQALDSIGGGFRPEEGGSSLAAALEASLEGFSEEARESERRKAVVLVGDGEDLTGEAPDLAALREANVQLFAIGVGSTAGGPVPLYDGLGRFVTMLQAADGREIVSRLREEPLRALAEGTGGSYRRLEGGLGTVNEVVTELQRLDASLLGEVEGGSVPADRYQIFLAFAVAALIVEELLSDRRRMPRPRGLRAPRRGPRARRLPAFGRASTLALLLGGAALAASSCTQAVGAEADALYLAGDHQGALERYRALIAERPDVVELRVNAGNALHQLGGLADAVGEYAFAIQAGTREVGAVAHYQLGNTLFRQGRLEEAREAYKDALRIQPADRDAKFNIELIDRLLREAEEEEDEQEPGDPGEQSGEQREGGEPGEPGETPGGSGEGESPPRGGDLGEAGEPGSEGPQAEGPPDSDRDGPAPDLGDVLSRFRSNLTPEEALRLLDALLAEQRGIEVLLEHPPQREGTDPTY